MVGSHFCKRLLQFSISQHGYYQVGSMLCCAVPGEGALFRDYEVLLAVVENLEETL